MKKLIVGMLFAFLVASGLVAATGSASNAACPYTGCVATKTAGKAKAKGGGKVRIGGKATSGRAKPAGKTVFILKGNGKYRKKIVSGNKGQVTFQGLPKGTYLVTIRFVPAKNSVYKGSQKRTTVTIR